MAMGVPLPRRTVPQVLKVTVAVADVMGGGQDAKAISSQGYWYMGEGRLRHPYRYRSIGLVCLVWDNGASSWEGIVG